MALTVTLYHKVDGAVEVRSAYVGDFLEFPDEWSKKPWPGQETQKDAAEPAAAGEAPGEDVRRRRRDA